MGVKDSTLVPFTNCSFHFTLYSVSLELQVKALARRGGLGCLLSKIRVYKKGGRNVLVWVVIVVWTVKMGLIAQW